MSTTSAVKFGGVHVRGSWATPLQNVSCELSVYTKTGQARIAELSERELLRLNEEVAIAMRQLATHRAARAEHMRTLGQAT